MTDNERDGLLLAIAEVVVFGSAAQAPRSQGRGGACRPAMTDNERDALLLAIAEVVVFRAPDHDPARWVATLKPEWPRWLVRWWRWGKR